MTCLLSKVEKEKMISVFVFVGASEICDGNSDRESKTDESCHICSMRQQSVLVKYEKYGTLSIYKS